MRPSSVAAIFTVTNGRPHVCEAVHGSTAIQARLEELFRDHGERIAGVVTEFPTNPLLQACDLEKVSELCSAANALLIVDPTMASPRNAKVSGLADVVVNSLTKYAGNEGDVMMGSLVFPGHSSLGRALIEPTARLVCPPFERDLLRMAEQVGGYEEFIETTNRSLIKVVEFLESHPGVKSVNWAYQAANRGAYAKLAGTVAGCGAPGERGQSCVGCNPNMRSV